MRGQVARRLSEGFDTHVRKDGTVIRLHAGGRLVGEVVVGEETTRVNFKNEFTPEVDLVAQAEGVKISGRSKVWAGGIRVNDANLDAVRQVLDAVRDDAVTTAERTKDVRASLAVIEEAVAEGYLDGNFEQALQELLDRGRSSRPRPRQGRGVRQTDREVVPA